MRPKDFYKLYAGKKYQLGDVDCFKMVYDYLAEMIELPETFEGLTLETYVQLYAENPDQAIETMINFFASVLKEKETYQFISGDILILEHEDTGTLAPGIFIANTSVILVTVEYGIWIGPLEEYKIRRCFKCPK